MTLPPRPEGMPDLRATHTPGPDGYWFIDSRRRLTGEEAMYVALLANSIEQFKREQAELREAFEATHDDEEAAHQETLGLLALREALESLRRAHFDCEDPWYSCAKHEGYIGESDVKECTCGADECNARIDAALGLAATGAPTPGMDGKESK
jgi:hypothetical protein